MADWLMKGEYLKNCNCTPTCTCDTIGFPSPHKNCEGTLGMNVKQGNFGDTDLSGVKWAVNYYWPGALHEGNGTAEIFVDEKASPEQRDGVMAILSGQNGGALFEIFSQIITTFHGPYFVPITFEFDKDARKATMSIPGYVETESEPLTVPATGDEQRIIVRMPGGFEYQEMEVAQTKTLKGTGDIKFDHKGTHSSLATVTHTREGVTV
jgi:hypothetical protein